MKRTLFANNRFVAAINNKNKQYRQGKRVSKNCLITAEERKAYVHAGVIAAVSMVKRRLNCTLAEAKELFDSERFLGYAKRNEFGNWE